MTIGERIKELRKAKGLTQAELGNILGVSASMIGQYENGFRCPKKESLLKIADALGIDYKDFLVGIVSAEEIAEELDMPTGKVKEILNGESAMPAEIQAKVFQTALALSIELRYKPKSIENLYREMRIKDKLADSPLTHEIDTTTEELVDLAYSLNDNDRALLLEMARSIKRQRDSRAEGPDE